VRAILPQAVRENSDGQLALNYNGTVALLVEAVKEQQSTIQRQKERIDQLERRLLKLENSAK
jgi:polyhydroxyalkanoate synthesis regulator phasin